MTNVTIMEELKTCTVAPIVAARICIDGEEVILKVGATQTEREKFETKLTAPMAECGEFIDHDTYTVSGEVWFKDGTWATCDYEAREGYHGFFQGYWVHHKYQIPEELGGPAE